MPNHHASVCMQCRSTAPRSCSASAACAAATAPCPCHQVCLTPPQLCCNAPASTRPPQVSSIQRRSQQLSERAARAAEAEAGGAGAGNSSEVGAWQQAALKRIDTQRSSTCMCQCGSSSICVTPSRPQRQRACRPRRLAGLACAWNLAVRAACIMVHTQQVCNVQQQTAAQSRAVMHFFYH